LIIKKELTEKRHMTRVLIVEDEPLSSMSLEMELTAVGYECVGIATSEEEAVHQFNEAHPDLVLMDINLEEGGSGIEAAKQINAIKKVPIVFVTAYASDDIIRQTGFTYPYGYVVKPYNIREVKAVIETALRRFEYEQETVKSQAKLSIAIKAADLGVWELNHQSKVMRISGIDHLKRYFRNHDQLLLDEFLELIVDEDRSTIAHILESGSSLDQKIRLKQMDENNLQDDRVRWLELYVGDTKLEDGKVKIGAIKDVTQLQEDMQSLALSDSIFHNMREGVALVNEQGIIQKANPALCEATGYSISELINSNFTHFIDHNRSDDITSINVLIKEQQESTIRRKDGSFFYALVSTQEVEFSSNGSQFVVIVTDISEIKSANDRLTELAFKDELTGLYNRSFMNRILAAPENYFSRKEFSLIFIDLDSFKLINDNLGHIAGDKILQLFSRRLVKAMRTSDFIIRHGGDEFVALINGHANESAITEIVKKINVALEQPFVIESESLTVTCSIGIAFCQNGENIHDLLRHADIAMYEAKRAGRNSFRIFDPLFAEKVRYQLFLEQGLRAAIENKKLEVWFQPIVDAHCNVVSYEALCRWQDENAGFISPEEFIPIAERSWLIYPLGLFVLEQACEFVKLMRSRGQDCKVNVNLSVKQVANVSLSEVFCEIVNKHGVSPQWITLEVTESALINEGNEAILKSLKQSGFTIALDDFGNGYSNLSRLREFPIDIIKLDKSLIQGRFEEQSIQIVTDAVQDMCLRLGYSLTVEGIETKQQFEHFSSAPSVLQQGYFHGKPQPAHELIQANYFRTELT
jgi:diguanylate cyclase (GGDEF)-like protein/PAS domain S-box-containing protein